METGLRAELPVLDDAADIKLTREELIERFAEIQNISNKEAEQQVGAETVEEVLDKIKDFTVTKINGDVKLNRAQRRALAKKNKGKKNTPQNQISMINDTAAKLNYIDLIQKLRKLNEEKGEENNGETIDEDD